MNLYSVLVSVAGAWLCLAAQAGNAAAAPCVLTPVGSATVTAVRDGGTLMLDDGRELRLAGIEIAPGRGEALRTLAEGRTLRLERLGADADRYGRLVAFATLPGDDRSCWNKAWRGFRPGSAIKPAPRGFWRSNPAPEASSAGCGPTPISPL